MSLSVVPLTNISNFDTVWGWLAGWLLAGEWLGGAEKKWRGWACLPHRRSSMGLMCAGAQQMS